MNDNVGVYHVHRFHLLTKTGTVLCGMSSAVRLQVTKDLEQVNCKLCLKKMARKLRPSPLPSSSSHTHP